MFSATQGKPITCRAAVLWEYNKPLTVETIVVDPPQAGEVRVKMVASGICTYDLLIQAGGMPEYTPPAVPGHEGGGIVESVGAGVTSVKPGDKVFALMLGQCKKCHYCKDGRSNCCTNQWGNDPKSLFTRSVGYDGKPRYSINGKPLYHVLGSSSFSEYVVIPETSSIKLNPKTKLEKACIMACGYLTGYGSASNLVDIRKGDIVAVWGLGGVGLAAIAGAKDKGAAKIIGIDVIAEKEEIARKVGATDFINTTVHNLEDSLQVLTEGNGLNYAIVCGGNTDVLETAVKLLGNVGSVVSVASYGPTSTLTIPSMSFFPQKSIIAAVFGGYKPWDDVPKLVDRYVEGKLPSVDLLVTHTIKLDEINEGYELLRKGKCLRTVVVF